MVGSYPIVLVYFGHCYLLTPLGPFSQRWYLLSLSLGYPSLRSSVVAVPLGLDSIW